ncbi:hypothetical protein TcWFU_008287 [Taenia crassiceps]|uniref:Uncharacterized protein n=1 Tax=Taenia crassiceps TaxID=6207 RepID=A0ABR4QMA1_9CEST
MRASVKPTLAPIVRILAGAYPVNADISIARESEDELGHDELAVSMRGQQETEALCGCVHLWDGFKFECSRVQALVRK